jgi:hypothetical protein
MVTVSGIVRGLGRENEQIPDARSPIKAYMKRGARTEGPCGRESVKRLILQL